MEKSRINLLNSRIYELEDAFFRGDEIDLKDFYFLKKELIDNREDVKDLLDLFLLIENMFDKRRNDAMNKKLNILAIWSTIFLPLSFYTGMWGMNFDDVPLLTGDNGFYYFAALTVSTIGVMCYYFKSKKWF